MSETSATNAPARRAGRPPRLACNCSRSANNTAVILARSACRSSGYRGLEGGGDGDGEVGLQVCVHGTFREPLNRCSKPGRHCATDGWRSGQRLPLRKHGPVRDRRDGGAAPEPHDQGVALWRAGARPNWPEPAALWTEHGSRQGRSASTVGAARPGVERASAEATADRPAGTSGAGAGPTGSRAADVPTAGRRSAADPSGQRLALVGG
jgi:hypothetical protein